MTRKRRKRHSPEQIVRKLRDADAMLSAGKDLAAVLQALDVSEATFRVADQPRASQRYEVQVRSDEAALVKRMLELTRQHPRYGYRFIRAKLRPEGWQVNRKRVSRLWRREGPKVPSKKRKKRRLGTSANACHRRRAEHPDHVWCWDFIFDRTASGSPLKWLSIEDEYTRECLCLKVDRRITSEDVIDTLAELFAMRGVPEHIRSDNGPEFMARAIQRWLEQVTVKTLYIEPASAWENGYAESFHSRFRDEFLATEVFENRGAARKLTAAWKEDYNHHRPHRSLGYLTPVEFAARCTASAPKLLSAIRLKQLLRSSRAAALPNPYSHNKRYRIRGQTTSN